MIYCGYMTSILDQSKLVDFCKMHDIAYLGVFGSASRGELTEKSDVDLLVRYQKEMSLLDHVGVAQELENTIGRKVDLVTEGSISRYLRPYIEKDLKTLYGQRSADSFFYRGSIPRGF